MPRRVALLLRSAGTVSRASSGASLSKYLSPVISFCRIFGLASERGVVAAPLIGSVALALEPELGSKTALHRFVAAARLSITQGLVSCLEQTGELNRAS